MSSGFAHVNGLKIYYEVHGEGGERPLVLLHGGAHTIELSFGRVLPALAEHRQVVAIELQGHGRTADTDREMSIEAFADDVLGVLDHLGIERADILGFSLGGLTALQFGLRHPRRTGRLVLLSANYRPDGVHEEIRANDPGSTRMPTKADFAEMRDAYVEVAPDPGHFETFLGRLSVLVNKTWQGWSDEELSGLGSPALIMIGDQDFTKPGHAVRMQELISGSQLAVLPDTKHVQIVNRPDFVLPMVEKFLDWSRVS
ncbi:alpha/beta hydrolase [Actinomadura barringtoniae]|uniref:Alpha/beta hydrolase n=1 Tax=Actinomadura barringtoniae TaxID=1427535 RepID=A0A939T7U2_9ACTN|nr:alpha/beta hydrolase [Actinomadura barringtoniae]MBO2446215.1 alpha/beta hydrolase [Actinomadura barringtoniae]